MHIAHLLSSVVKHSQRLWRIRQCICVCSVSCGSCRAATAFCAKCGVILTGSFRCTSVSQGSCQSARQGGVCVRHISRAALHVLPDYELSHESNLDKLRNPKIDASRTNLTCQLLRSCSP